MTRPPLKIHCDCGAWVFATSDSPLEGEGGKHWPLRDHCRPGAEEACEHRSVSSAPKTLSWDDLTPESQARIRAEGERLAARLRDEGQL